MAARPSARRTCRLPECGLARLLGLALGCGQTVTAWMTSRSGQVTVRAAAANPGSNGVHQPGVGLSQISVAEAESVEGLRTHIGDKTSASQQAVQNRHASGC